MTSQSKTTSALPAPGDPPGVGGALVTEAGGPIGSAIARALAGLGYAVHLTDMDGRLAARAAADLGALCFGSALDVRSLPACRAAASRTRRRLGSLDVWVNAAAIAGAGPAWELDERSRQRLLDLILVGTINGTLAALEGMRPSGRGHVINVIELSGLLPRGGQAVYAAGQHGVLAFSQGASADLRAAGLPEVNVSCLCPSTRLVGQPRRLGAALAELLDQPRPLLAVPRWLGALVRARCLWPASGPLSTGVMSTLLDPAGPGRRPGRSRLR